MRDFASFCETLRLFWSITLKRTQLFTIKKNVYEFYTIPYEEEKSATVDEKELTATAEIIDIKTKSALPDKKVLTGTAENKNSALADDDSQKTGGNNDLIATAEQNFAKEWGF